MNQQREYFFHDHFHFVQCFVTGELIILFLNLRNWSVYLIIHCVDNYTNDDTDELSRLHITYLYIFSKFFIFHRYAHAGTALPPGCLIERVLKRHPDSSPNNNIHTRSLQPLIFLPVHELEHFGIGTSDFASDHQLTHCRSTVSEPRRDPTSLRAKLQPWSRAWAKLFSDHIARRQPESELWPRIRPSFSSPLRAVVSADLSANFAPGHISSQLGVASFIECSDPKFGTDRVDLEPHLTISEHVGLRIKRCHTGTLHPVIQRDQRLF
ncbi:hypothetical protein CBS470a_011993 [Colletotrichum nupharicola]|nr:hypothetical protein CBS470a_011993 [Colletotrichum nupharicola]